MEIDKKQFFESIYKRRGPKVKEDREQVKENAKQSKLNYVLKNMQVCELCRPVLGERIQRNMTSHRKTKVHQEMLRLSQQNNETVVESN